jgi:hypothetical protein
MTEITSSSPGKFVLTWSEMTADERGIITLGSYLPAVREPRVRVSGPRSVAIREALGHVRSAFRIAPRDLRPPLGIQWGGAASGGSAATSVMFKKPGQYQVRVDVTDDDRLTATDQITVNVRLIPLKVSVVPFPPFRRA